MKNRSIQNQRHERTRHRQPRPPRRRQGTRHAVVYAALQEA